MEIGEYGRGRWVESRRLVAAVTWTLTALLLSDPVFQFYTIHVCAEYAAMEACDSISLCVSVLDTLAITLQFGVFGLKDSQHVDQLCRSQLLLIVVRNPKGDPGV